jgi:hypothetical protein
LHVGLPATAAVLYSGAQIRNLCCCPAGCVQLSDAIVLRFGVRGDVATFAVQAQLVPKTAYLGLGLSELGSMKGAGQQQQALSQCDGTAACYISWSALVVTNAIALQHCICYSTWQVY